MNSEYTIDDDGLYFMGEQQIDIKYEFLDEVGKKHEGKNFHKLSEYKMKKYNLGDEIDIIYYKENPELNFWVKENLH